MAPQPGAATPAEAAALRVAAALREKPTVLQQLGGHFGSAFPAPSASSEPTAGLSGGGAGSQAPAEAGDGQSVPVGDGQAPAGNVSEVNA